MPDSTSIAQQMAADSAMADSLQHFYQWHDAYPVQQADTCLFASFESLMTTSDSVTVRPSLFTGHGLAPQHDALAPRQHTAAPAWLFAVTVLLCAAICLFYRNRKIKLGELLKSAVDMRAAERLLRGLQQVRSLPLWWLAPILATAVATAVWCMAMQGTGFVGWLLLAVALTVGYYLRNGLLTLLANIFERQPTMAAYINGNYLYHQLLATVVVPLLFAVAYIPSAATAAVWTMGVLAAVVFIMRFIRGVQLFLTKSQSPSLFLFYYLCIVETAPLLILLKWFISQ